MNSIFSLHKGHKYPWWWIVGVLLIGTGLYFLIRDIPKWNVLWYVFAWYGYLLIVDVVIFVRQGHSFLSHRSRELLEMMAWSVPFWFLFEAYNFALQNWYYVFALHSDFYQGVFAWLAFATVLPACFFHAELLKSLGVFRDTKVNPIRVENGLQQFFLYFGALCIVLPLIFPKYAFWMVWGATLGVPDYINYTHGAPSILGDLKKGQPGRLSRLLVGGMIAGLVWEGLNYWARCKWIYTVPGLEALKIFEMPVVGFLGFPVLAVEAFAFYSLVSYYLRSGRTWEISDHTQQTKSLRKWYWPLLVIGMAASLMVYSHLLDTTLQSRRPVFADYPGLDASVIDRLHTTSMATPERFYRQAVELGTEQVAQILNIPEPEVRALTDFTSLVLHKGMGIPDARIVKTAGIQHVTGFIGQSADQLYPSLEQVANTAGLPVPGRAEVKVWIRAAELAQGLKR